MKNILALASALISGASNTTLRTSIPITRDTHGHSRGRYRSQPAAETQGSPSSVGSRGQECIQVNRNHTDNITIGRNPILTYKIVLAIHDRNARKAKRAVFINKLKFWKRS